MSLAGQTGFDSVQQGKILPSSFLVLSFSVPDKFSLDLYQWVCPKERSEIREVFSFFHLSCFCHDFSQLYTVFCYFVFFLLLVFAVIKFRELSFYENHSNKAIFKKCITRASIFANRLKTHEIKNFTQPKICAWGNSEKNSSRAKTLHGFYKIYSCTEALPASLVSL